MGGAVPLRLIALVLAWALVLLPASLGPLPISVGDQQAHQTVVNNGSAGLVLSNYDRSQSAIRNAEIGLPEPGPRRLELSRPRDAAVKAQQFSAFSARAPPLRA
ncbi:hypothetical protein [Aminobacter sp. MET-1]|uniref:hypothetical protein n=1 Tax=Aminobacter sp. MET-1 TaxID=2951085 RepID=UPI002269DE10|nr:hypothetical protein [Aminobacter sp. MET-1]MCX8567643.1 hypothetical protein [Aminobacter sp. MET-1]